MKESFNHLIMLLVREQQSMRLLGNTFVKFLSSTLTDGCLTNWNANLIIDFPLVNEVPYQIV